MIFSLKVKDVVDANNVIVSMADPGTPKNYWAGPGYATDSQDLRPRSQDFVERPLQAVAWTYFYVTVERRPDLHGSYIYNWQISPSF